MATSRLFLLHGRWRVGGRGCGYEYECGQGGGLCRAQSERMEEREQKQGCGVSHGSL